jgi:hypothetical protein
LAYVAVSRAQFGSMLTETERLGDVDLAVELSSKATGEKAFDRWCDRRQNAALKAGQRFKSDFDWVVWPKAEVYRALRGRARTLSIHEWDQIKKIADVRYRVVWGDRKRIARLIPDGKPC